MLLIFICNICGDSHSHLQEGKTNVLGHQNFKYFFIMQLLIGLITYRITKGRNFSFGLGFLHAFEVKNQ